MEREECCADPGRKPPSDDEHAGRHRRHVTKPNQRGRSEGEIVSNGERQASQRECRGGIDRAMTQPSAMAQTPQGDYGKSGEEEHQDAELCDAMDWLRQW